MKPDMISGAMIEVSTSLVITEKIIPVSKIIGISLNIRHHFDDF